MSTDTIRVNLRDWAAQRVRVERTRMGLSQEQLAERAGVGKSTVERIEHAASVGSSYMDSVFEVLDIRIN